MNKHGPKLTAAEREEMVKEYQDGKLTIDAIAEKHGITRQAVWKMAKVRGIYVERPRGKARQPRVPITCDHCGKVVVKMVTNVVGYIRHFCSKECYYAALAKGNGKPLVMWRHGSRVARETVSKHYRLQPHNVVHHIDRDQTNNDLSNLWVFENNAQHMSFHRGGSGEPIWRGDVKAALQRSSASVLKAA